MGQWYNWQLYLHYNHVWWVVLHLNRVMRILFRPKKHSTTGSCSKLHIHLKRELSHETRIAEIIPTTKHMLCAKHMLCDIVSCQCHSVQLQKMAKMTSSPGPSCGKTWSNAVLQVLLIVPALNCVVIVWWKRQSQHSSPFRILVDCSKEDPSYSST
jgi:hypothetical protein